MHIKQILSFFFSIGTLLSFGQAISGNIKDGSNKEDLIGVSITSKNQGTVSNVDGDYRLTLNPGKHIISYNYIGYEEVSKEIEIKDGEEKIINIEMEISSTTLQTVVVSAGKFEQKIEEITVSMEVIKPTLIEEKNTTNIQTVMDQVPGVNITDGQANIRGGSGWSYGAGTRVLVMVDDMPLISGDAGQVQWRLIATENINQVEVIKGASSVLYGSSALNGVINIRTAFPTQIDIDRNPSPGFTKVNTHFGLIDFPKREELIWWNKNKRRAFKGVEFFHARKINNLSLTLGGNWFDDDGYRQGEITKRNRFNFSTSYRSKKFNGLTYGLNGNFLWETTGSVLIWEGYDNAYLPLDGEITTTAGDTYNIDPFITFRKGNNLHSLRTRYLKVINDNSTKGEDVDQDNKSEIYFSDYQWQKNLEVYNLRITSGITNEMVYAKSDLFQGKNFRKNHSFYSQIDKKWKKLNISFGARYELYSLHSDKGHVIDGDTINDFGTGKPVFRSGLNYQIGQGTFIRSSWGQGYRFPSMAELFITATQSGLEIYPNPELKPEDGWSAEIGIKQVVKFGKWTGFADLAGFIMRYKNMMEFSFGQWGDYQITPIGQTPTMADLGVGFKSVNSGETQISGIEFSLNGYGELSENLNMTILAGYTYINPIPIDPSFVYALDYNDYPVSYQSSSSDASVLKYRYQNIAKIDIGVNYKKSSIGISARYNDFMQNIDSIFTTELINEGIPELNIPPYIPGLNESRENTKNGDLIFDLRLGYHLSKDLRIGFIVNNLLNREYMSRPADMKPPRTMAIQCSYKL